MARFRKGQLVAVRHEHFGPMYKDEKWRLAIYLRKAKTIYCAQLVPTAYLASRELSCWHECVPAQEIWPWLKDLNPRVIDNAT